VASCLFDLFLKYQRLVFDGIMMEYCFEACCSNVAQSDMLVPVVSRAEPVFRVVQMDHLEILKTDNIVELCKGPVDRLLHMEIIASCIRVTGVETDSDTVLLRNAVVYRTDLLELSVNAVAGT